jgi:hypothetical protein
MRGGYKLTEVNGEVHKEWPAVKKLRRISKVRLERLQILLRYFKEGKSVQEIAALTGWRKDRVYHEMYYLKNLGLLDPDFKNPSGFVHTKDVAKEVAKGAKV